MGLDFAGSRSAALAARTNYGKFEAVRTDFGGAYEYGAVPWFRCLRVYFRYFAEVGMPTKSV